SRNGTFVEGERLIGQRILRDGEKVQLGVTALLAFALLDPLEREVSARVYESGTRDPLTGLYNRRVLFEHLDRELSYAARHFTALSLMLIDLDHFKSINDRWGHLAGDRVLEVVARTVTATLRTEDIVARYGGEELAVVVRGVDLASSHIVAERLRATIAHSEVLWEGDRVPITASLGLAHCVGGCHARDLIEAADGALYAAKREGRNRVMVAAPQGERR
ncbi:MAG: diguanylate cyclase, partial [Myxococcales bacterium]|nr:diguanylate cyclase [Myxococcales bacterium]